jgi:hypothetical protein
MGKLWERLSSDVSYDSILLGEVSKRSGLNGGHYTDSLNQCQINFKKTFVAAEMRSYAAGTRSKRLLETLWPLVGGVRCALIESLVIMLGLEIKRSNN